MKAYELTFADFSHRYGVELVLVSRVTGHRYHVVVRWNLKTVCSSCTRCDCRHVRAALLILGGNPRTPRDCFQACELLMTRLVALEVRQHNLAHSGEAPRWSCVTCSFDCCRTRMTCPQCRVPVLATACHIKA